MMQTACNSYTWMANNMMYTASGTYTNATTNATTGCQDTASLVLTINNSANTSMMQTACNSYTWMANNMMYTASGTYTNATTNATTGCQDTASLVLTINNSANTSMSATACNSYTWMANNMMYTASGTYTNATTNATTGCQDTASLVLTINNSANTSMSATACNSYTWMANNMMYTASGTYINVTTDSITGCQDTATLVLTINNSANTSMSATAFGTYTWAANAAVYTMSGTYQSITVNAGTGCSDTATLILTINQAVQVSPKVFLNGNYNATAGTMTNTLNTGGLIPSTEPYTTAPYSYAHLGGGGGETLAPGALSGTGSNSVVDWVIVELRDASASGTRVATRSALVQRDGDVVDVDGTSPVLFATTVPGNYFVSVKHRNHLGVMTNSAIALSGVPATVDFTATSTALFARPAPNSNGANGATFTNSGKRTLYAGNCNIASMATRRILTYNSTASSDRAALLTAAPGTSTIAGYTQFDCDLNGLARFNGLTPDRLVILINCYNSNSLILNEQTPN
jgi:hypothetical protein